MNENPESDPIFEITEMDSYTRIDYRDLISMEKQIRLIDIIYAMHLSKGYSKFIVNTQGCQIRYSILERHQVAIYLAEKLKSNVAVAYIVDKNNLTGVVENSSRNRGGSRIKITDSADDALNWIKSA